LTSALPDAFDLLELDGTDLRREPIEVRKATLASILRKSRHGVCLNEHLEHDCGLTVFQHACKMGLEGIVSKRLGSRYRSGRSPDWLKFKNPQAPAVRREAEEDLGATIEQRLFHVRRRPGADSSGWYVVNGHTRRPASGTFKTQAAAEARRKRLQNKHNEALAAAMRKLAEKWQRLKQ
jgi:ATP-dependent DNA ligase